MRIKLISPMTKSGILSMRSPLLFFGPKYGGAPLALPTIAALTPPGVEVSLVDENVKKINFEEKVDLVGITFNVAGAKRAYQIADVYRARKVKVILGGVYVSMLPEEASGHADAIVVGEAESVWASLVSDAQNGQLKPIYRASQLCNMEASLVPRWDLLDTAFYNYHSVQTTRGCPFDCDYCSVTYLFGGTYRHKPVEKVVQEVELLKKIDKKKLIFFVDDNITNNRSYAVDLFKALIPLGVRWTCQAPIVVAKDDDLLKLMHESGCRELFIGFESLSQESLAEIGKGGINKAAEFEDAINRIYSHHISIFGSFMLGADHDDQSIFKRTIDFINSNGIAISLINILVPPPGTRLFKRLEQEGRILHHNWEYYSGEQVVFRPKQMSENDLQGGFYSVLNEVYSYDNILFRLSRLWKRGILLHKNKNKLSLYRAKVLLWMLASSLLRGKFANALFSLKCFMLPYNVLLTPVILNMSMHEYTGNLLRKK